MKRQLSFAAVVFLILATALSVHAIYDQIATGTWGSAGNLAESRSGAAAVRLDDGRVLFIGGFGANGPLSSAEALTAGGGFAATAPMAEARKGHTATMLLDGRVLVTGGDNGSGATVTAEVYDPDSNGWWNVGNLLTPRAGHTASLLDDGRVLIVGGENSGGPVAAVEIFDPISDSFSHAGILNTARSEHAAAVLYDGRVLIAGGKSVGQDGNPVTLSSVEIYDPASGSVTNGPALAIARSRHSATSLLDGNIFVMGGNDGSQDLASAEIYDAAANTWTTSSSSAATPRSGHAACLLPNNANVLIVGGGSAGTDLNSAELFEPSSGSFKSTGSMTATHPGIAGAAVGAEGFLAVAGGASPGSEVYHFATVKTDQDDYAPGTLVLMTGSGWQPGETVTLHLEELPDYDSHPDMTTVADSNGNISFDQWAPDDHDLNIRFYLTARGSQSQAQTTFMDSVASVGITSVTPAATITSLPTTVTANFTYTTSTTGTTTGQLDIVGSGVSATKSLVPGVGLSDSISVNVPAGTPNGSYNVKVTVTNNTGTGANQKNDQVNGAVVINVPTCTSPSVTTNPTDQAVTFGAVSVSFTAAASGTPAPTVQWQVSTNSGASFSNIAGATSATFSINNPTVAMSGNSYRAVFTNSCTPATATSTAATLTVNKATPTITWANPADITYGTALSGTQLNATANVAGTFTYTPVAGTVLAVGSTQNLHVDFVPSDSANYNNASKDVKINVIKAHLTVTADDKSRAYGASDPELTYVISGFVNGENLGSSGVTGTATCSTTATSTSPASPPSYPITCTNGSLTATNYDFPPANFIAGALTITKIDATVSVTGYSGPYTATPHGATGTATGLLGVDLSGLLHVDPTTYTDVPGGLVHWTFDGNTNYNSASGDATVTITKVDATVSVTAYSGPYTATPHGATGTATGLLGVDLSGLLHVDPTTYTDVPGGLVHWTFDGDTNYNSASGDATVTITKVDATVSVTGYSGPYTATPHGATGTATGLLGADLSGLLHVDPTTYTDVPGGLVHWTFDGNTNYNSKSGDATVTITKVDATVSVTGYSGPYTATPHGATGTATGLLGANLNSLLHVAATSYTDVPGGLVHWTFDGNTNYNSASGDATVTITKVDATIVVIGYDGLYTGTAHGATGTATGLLGANLNSLLHVAATTYTDVPGGLVNWTFDGNTNYNSASGNAAIVIKKADPNIVVTPYNLAYDSAAHMATGTAKGVQNESLSGLDLSSTTHTNPGNYTDPWTFTDSTGNYNNKTGMVNDRINYGVCSAGVGPGSVILPPINSDGTSVYNRKGGSTIPVKFTVCDASGNPIGTPAAVFAGTGGSITLLSEVRGTITVVNETATNDIPDVAFRFTGGQWIFNMATTNLNQGSTYTFRINLAYGSITFKVGVK